MGTRGMGRIFRRGPYWHIQYSDKGVLKRESSESGKLRVATKLLKKRLGEIAQGRLVGPDVERTTFEQLAEMLSDDYVVNGRKSLDRAKRSVHHLREFFGDCRAMEITADRVSAYIRSRKAIAKPGTVRLELAALNRLFTLGFRAGKVGQRPWFPSIEVRNTRTGFFEECELRAVLEQLPTDLRLLIEFTHLTGWRIGEARQLEWRRVDFDAGNVRLEPGTTKNDDARSFPFAALPRLEELLRSQREHTSALEREQERLIPWVFHRNGKPIQSFHEAWRRACARAGVPGRLIHDLRRTAVRNFERAGVSRSVAMKLTGHKTESIYRRYAIVSDSDLAEGVRKVAVMRSADPNAAHGVARISNENLATSTERAQFPAESADARRALKP